MTYLIQIDDEVREANEAEAKKIEDAQAEAQERNAELEAQAQAKASAESKLVALGLTSDEIAALKA
jgi:vacuolar-type H+-ATPase subunit H